jgi:glycosyltransferase involved in cell wall biosynthesis
MARAFLGLPADKHLVLVGAERGMREPHKGGDVLREMIPRAAQLSAGSFELVVYGQSSADPGDRWPCPVHWLGPVRDDRVLVASYSAANAMVVPSRQENLPNTAVEAQACGLPVVAFDVGGLPDIVSHKHSGWLAKPFDVQDLAEGLLWVLNDADRWSALSNAAREHATERFAEPVVAAQYAAVYAEALGRPALGR